jgi:flagellar biosynthesis protein
MEKPRPAKGPKVPTNSPALPAVREPAKVAVALGCPLESKQAPKVLASGRGAVAEQILNIAFAQGVRVREDADLAQLLAAVDIDSEIPVQAFAAVAEILVYVWRANSAAAGDPLGLDAAPADQPLPDQPFMERAKGPAG